MTGTLNHIALFVQLLDSLEMVKDFVKRQSFGSLERMPVGTLIRGYDYFGTLTANTITFPVVVAVTAGFIQLVFP